MKDTESKSLERTYQEDILPLLDEVDDPFRSIDIEEVSEYNASFIGRTLTNASKEDEYQIERIATTPGIFTLNGNNPEDYGGEGHRLIFRTRAANNVTRLLEEIDSVTDSKLESILIEEVEENYELENFTAKWQEVGKIKDELKESEEVFYNSKSMKYSLED
jgi:hypothetical protein